MLSILCILKNVNILISNFVYYTNLIYHMINPILVIKKKKSYSNIKKDELATFS